MKSKRRLLINIKIIASYNIFQSWLVIGHFRVEFSITAADTMSIGDILEGIKHFLINTKKYVYYYNRILSILN